MTLVLVNTPISWQHNKTTKGIELSNPIIDLTERNRDYAVFLPSISTFYSAMLSKQINSGGSHIPPERVPSGFENGVEGCNFLNEDEAYYKYKWGLYSAGHAQLDLSKADHDDHMVQQRDRNKTFILGDSGGFQIIKGVIKCNWDEFKTDDSLRHTILNWLEHTADYSMILDIPTQSADPAFRERTKITGFEQCLEYTKYNCDWFVKNRKGNTKYLNVMQGRSLYEAETWYEGVKHYPFEGWAFGGHTKSDINIMLRILLRMRDDKLLEQGERDVLHFLGTSKLDWAVAYTALKRALRHTVNQDIEVMFDCASPFIATAKGQMYTQHIHSNDKFSYVMDSAIDNKCLSGSKLLFPWSSPIADRLTMGDVCWYAPGMLNKIGKEGKTSWDSFSYFLLMSHNVYQHIESVQRSNQLTDIALAQHTVNHKDWVPTKKGKSVHVDNWVPDKTLFMAQFIDDLFKSETPMTLLDQASGLLAAFNGKKSVTSSDKVFNSLFDMDDQTYDYPEQEDQETAEEFMILLDKSA